MNNQEKLNMIKYSSYKYSNKKWNSNETEKFFNLDFSKLLFDSIPSITNSQTDLLSFFDFKDIFDNFNNDITDIQNYVLKFMVMKNVRGINTLLENMPKELEYTFFYQLYLDLYSNDSRPFWFSRIICCLKKQDIPQFVDKLIDQVSDDEIVFMIKDLYENKSDMILSALMNKERVANVAIKRISAPFFYEMVTNLNLQNELLNKRQQELQDILINYQDYNANDVKDAFCDLYLHDTLHNVLLDIKTIVDFATDDATFQYDCLGDTYGYLCTLLNFFSNDDEVSISDINSNALMNHDTLAKCYLMCQQHFKELVSESINQDITKNLESKILFSSSGDEVRLFNIENQTEIQKKITMLVSTVPCSDTASEFKKIYCSEYNGEVKNNRRSCSLINESKLSSLFGGENRIILGFEDLNGRIITSATLGDGRTDGNEEKFRKRHKVARSNYSSVDKFISDTQGHTEITINMGKTNKVMVPSYILTTKNTPTQFEIDVAAEFQIPIRYVNINRYKQEPNNNYKSEDYDYYHFEKKEVTTIKNDRSLI